MTSHQVHLMPWAAVEPEQVLDLILANRAHLKPWEPLRPDSYFTLAGQREVASAMEESVAAGREYVAAMTAEGRPVGRVALTGIERGQFQSCHLGYWTAVDRCNRGFATAAVSEILSTAFGELGLHRVEAAVMPANLPSVRVLEKCGFRREGLALAYLRIQGIWEDHLIYARTGP